MRVFEQGATRLELCFRKMYLAAVCRASRDVGLEELCREADAAPGDWHGVGLVG